MAGLNWRNMTLRILSVLLALLLWIYASNEQNPLNDQILSIQLQRRDPPKGMEVSSSIPSNVSIRVQGPRTQVTSLTPADFQAVLDLSGITEGDHYIQIKVNTPPGIQVTQVTPGRVHVVVESIVEKQVGVSASFKGSPPRGYTAGEPVIQPARVTIKGPRSKVDSIDQMKVTVDLETATGAVEQTLPLTAGQAGVSVFPQTVKVNVPVSPLPSKTVAARATVTGDAAKDFEVAGFTVNPANVQVVAPSGVLAGINWVETDKIDVRGVDHDFTVKVAVTPPPGAVDVKPSIVEVTVQIKKKSQAPAPGPVTPGRS